ncbi:MAG TPA: hypothetical protein VM122_02940 [Usitatibacter sp.]|nr:hypothetical protein [Usitatibacter sp.]
MSSAPAPWQGPDAAAVRPALNALLHARQRTAHTRQHRGLVRLQLGPYALQAIFLPAAFICLLVHFEPALVDFWGEFVMTWAQALELPLRATTRPGGWGEVRVAWNPLATATVLPGDMALAVAAVVTLVVFLATFAMRSSLLPLRYLLRILCAVQAVSIVFFAMGNEFPYDITDHVRSLASAGFVLLAAIPVMLAMGYYVLRVPVATKLLHTALILGYFIAWVPLQILVHAVLLQHLGVLVMPLLYFCFGAVLNFLLFIALYGWVASTAPAVQ